MLKKRAWINCNCTVLVIGGGGREHAIAMKIAESSRVYKVLVSPGNGGTDAGNGKIGAHL